MGKDLIEKKEPSVPGVGVSGQVMCPLGFQRTTCCKQACEWWVELNYGDEIVGRCSVAWATVLLTELRQSLDNFLPKKEQKESEEEVK